MNRWARFKANRIGYASLWIFTILFGLSLCAELIANDKPLIVRYQGQFYFPIAHNPAETVLAAVLALADLAHQTTDLDK